MKRSWTLLLMILLLALPVLACDAVSGLVGDDEPGGDTAAATAESPAGDTAQEAVEDGAGEAATGPEALDLATLASGLQDVNSYRVTIEMRVEGQNESGETETVSLIMENATVVEPPAGQTTITFTGLDEVAGLGNLEFISVGDTTYSTVPGIGCISAPAGAADADLGNPFADLFNSNDFIGDVQGARRQLPDENINGVDTYHFVFDETALQDTENNLENVDGHIYIAKEGGYVVRLVMDGTGRVALPTTGQEQEGQVHLEMNTRDVNQPIDIQPPENCDTFNLEDLNLDDLNLDDIEIPSLGGSADDAPYPLFAENTELFVLDDIMSFQTEAPLDEVVAFYQTEMPLAGFEPVADGTVLTNDAAVLQFSQAGQNFYVTISEDGGIVYVQIVPE